MNNDIITAFKDSIAVKQACQHHLVDIIATSVQAVITSLKAGHKILLFGNGGSAADSQHIAAEFVGRFYQDRQALAAMALTTDSSVLTCLANDYDYQSVFSRQIEALGQPGDIAWGISTSGKSENVYQALMAAKAKGLVTLGMTGRGGGKIADAVDLSLVVPSDDTARIQEAHICISHIICQCAEQQLFPQ